ncbi:hypothetical protein B0H16DRAFT_1699093 [Mycena metata]|uniref:Uncharacterized protein n=1 Tax=Mycena metata TaxID=1033252 RepID=A0AAD7MLH6_9AGAR|nr:hypothetical protein B0H16DRAFT_1699093 [Mycena metata]
MPEMPEHLKARWKRPNHVALSAYFISRTYTFIRDVLSLLIHFSASFPSADPSFPPVFMAQSQNGQGYAEELRIISRTGIKMTSPHPYHHLFHFWSAIHSYGAQPSAKPFSHYWMAIEYSSCEHGRDAPEHGHDAPEHGHDAPDLWFNRAFASAPIRGKPSRPHKLLSSLRLELIKSGVSSALPPSKSIETKDATGRLAYHQQNTMLNILIPRSSTS